MLFGIWKKKPPLKQGATNKLSRSGAHYGGMQVRELQARLEIVLDAVLNRHLSVLVPAQKLAALSLMDQQRFLDSVDRISLINTEYALQFCYEAIPALGVLDEKEWDPWIDSLLETLDADEIGTSVDKLKNFQAYHQKNRPDPSSVAFDEVARILNVYLQALSDSSLKISTSESAYSDTQTLFLPPSINHFSSRDQNFKLYKSLLVHQWAQTVFGTWHINLDENIKSYADQKRALRLFHALETLRLDACIKRELPGMSRTMAVFRVTAEHLPLLWQQAETQLQHSKATVLTTLACLKVIYPETNIEPQAALYQRLLLLQSKPPVSAADDPHQADLPEARQQQDSQELTPSGIKESAGARPTDILENNLLQLDPNSLQDQQADEQIADNAYEIDAQADPKATDEENQSETEAQNYSYHEWDHSRQRYRKNWCQLHEKTVTPVAGGFAKQTLHKYRVLLKQLQRSFEVMRQQNQRLKREPVGDDIDIDAAVESWVDVHNGFESSDRVFTQVRKNNRNVAVMFMIDMSASTAGWVNQVERESLILLCETLESLDDRYAIYGFSGRGNKQCHSFHIKDFNEKYNTDVHARIEGIQSQDYTRLGAAIRHLGTRLSQIDASTKLLITLSDGKPDDVDGYQGRYGIEDTRMAVIEMRHLGIHPYCITIDSNAREYIPHMFGENGFTIINQVEQLPVKIAHIYRKLTV